MLYLLHIFGLMWTVDLDLYVWIDDVDLYVRMVDRPVCVDGSHRFVYSGSNSFRVLLLAS